MSTTIIAQTTPNFHTEQLDAALRLLEAGHAGGGAWYYSRPSGKGFEQDWRQPGRHIEPRRAWQADNVFVSANPHAEIPTTNARGEKTSPKWIRGTGDNIHSVGWLFCEIDAKDTISQAEWLPFYVAPDVSGMTKSQARGALQKAETAAIDAALVVNLAEYKRRALAAMEAITPRATAAWDSGGGCWGVWLFDAPVILDDTNRADVAHVQKEWVRRGGGDPAASDLNRVFRMPGTVNHKKKYGPNGHPVVFLWYDLAVRYPFAELAALAPALPEQASVKPRRVYVPAGLPATLGEFANVPILPYHPAIDDYNRSNGLHDLLLEYGYTDAGGGRMNRPGGDSAGVQLHGDNTASIYSSADPLYCGHRVTPAHALCVFEYDGSIDDMLAALTGCARPLPPMSESLKWQLLEWAQSRAARELLRDVYGIRRPDTYLRTVEALIDLAAKKKTWCFIPGARSIGSACNTSHESASKHLQVLNGTFWQLWKTERGSAVDLGLLYWQFFKRPYAKVDTSPESDPYAKVDRVVESLKNTVNLSVDPEKRGGVNLSVGVQFQYLNLNNDTYVPVAYVHAMARRMETTVLLPSLGYAGRATMAAILETPGITKAEIAERYGLSLRTLEKTLQVMERMRLFVMVDVEVDVKDDDGEVVDIKVFSEVVTDADGCKCYTAVNGAVSRLADLLPHMTSYKTGARRAELAEQSRAKWLYKQLRNTSNPVDRALLAERLKACDELQASLCAELTNAGIRSAKGWRPHPPEDRGIVTQDRDQAAEQLDVARIKQGQAAAKLTVGDRWRRHEYAKSKHQAAEQWEDFSAWLFLNHGPEFVTMDETQVLGKFKVWEIIRDSVPTVSMEVAA